MGGAKRAVRRWSARSLRTRLFLAVLSGALLMTVVLGTLAYRAAGETLRTETVRAVGVAAEARREAVLGVVTRQRHRLQEFLVAAELHCELDAPENRGRCLRRELEQFLRTEGARAGILLRDGQPLVQVGPGAETLASVPRGEAEQGAVLMFPTPTGPSQGYVVRNVHGRDALDGAVWFDPARLRDTFAGRYGLGETGETFLVGPRGGFVIPDRNGSGRRPLPDVPWRRCLSGEDGEVLAHDPRGAAMITGFRHVPELGGACVVASIEQAEAFAPIRRLAGMMLVTTLFLGAVAAVISLWLARSVTRPVHRLTASARALQAGDFTREIRVEGPSEVRELAAAMAAMKAAMERSQRALEEASRRTELILESAGEGIYGLDADGRVTFANSAAVHLVGWTQEELIGQSSHALLHHSRPDGTRYEKEDCPIHQALGEGQTRSVASEVYWRKDGTPFPVEYTSTPIMSGARVIGAVVLFRDITQRRSAEEALRASEQRYATTLSSIGDAVIATDERSRVLFMNPVAEQLTGWKLFDCAGRPLDEVFPLVHEDTRERASSLVGTVIREQAVVGMADHTALVARDGVERSIEDSAAPIRAGDGRLAGVVLVFRDVSEKRREEQRRRFLAKASTALLSSLEFERTLVAVSNLAVDVLADLCAVYLLGEDGNLHALSTAHRNPAAREQVRAWAQRYEPSRETSSILHRVLDAQQALLLTDIPDELLAANARDPEHLEVLRSLGMRSAMIVPLAVRGRPVGVVVFVASRQDRRFDARDLAMAEELGERAAIAVENARLYKEAQEAVRLRDEFLSVASHELRTPLTTLQLQLEVLERNLGTAGNRDERALSRLKTAHRQTGRLARLVESLLDVSRITTGRMTLDREEVDLGALVADSVERFEEQARVAGSPLRFHRSTAPILGHWDRLRLEQVLSNLLSNAIKYGAGGPVEVRISEAAGIARVDVRDEGMGVPPQDVERIFGRFERAVSSRNYGGLGLGLFIARQIVEAHGGRISVQAGFDGGSEFTVLLPTAPQPQAATQEDWVH